MGGVRCGGVGWDEVWGGVGWGGVWGEVRVWVGWRCGVG